MRGFTVYAYWGSSFTATEQAAFIVIIPFWRRTTPAIPPKSELHFYSFPICAVPSLISSQMLSRRCNDVLLVVPTLLCVG